jgi:RHS repeat-associated protein
MSMVEFTSKERDAETGLDFFNARDVASAQGRFTSPDPSNLSVDFFLPQTWNRYAYVGNNPLVYVDRNCLWWTSTHEHIIDDSFPGLSEEERQQLKDVSYATDHSSTYLGIFDSQSGEASPTHDMSNGNDPDAAHAFGLGIELSDQFIDRSEADARAIQAAWIASGHTGIAPNAMIAFGRAQHTVADSTSPSHKGHQPWGCTWCASGLWHVLRENSMRYRGARKTATVGAVGQAYLDTFGFMELMHAMDGLRPKVTSILKPCGGDGQPACPK